MIRVVRERLCAVDPALLGGLLVPHWSVSPSVIAAYATDRHIAGDTWLVFGDDLLLGAIPIWTVKRERLTAAYARAMATVAYHPDPPPATPRLVGSPSEMFGGFLHRPGRHTDVAAALGIIARSYGEPLHALFAPYPLAGTDGSCAPGPPRWRVEIGPSEQAYMYDVLDNSRRGVVRRDRRDFDACGLRASHRAAEQADIDQALCALVSGTKARHGVNEPWRLAMLRLQMWVACVERPVIALVLDQDGALVAASLSCRLDNTRWVHEAGVDWRHPHAHRAYLESVFYSPMRVAWASDCTSVDLAFDAARPKTLRGARAHPTWHCVCHP